MKPTILKDGSGTRRYHLTHILNKQNQMVF